MNLICYVFMMARSSGLVLLVISLNLLAVHFNGFAVENEYRQLLSSGVKTWNLTECAGHRTSVGPWAAQLLLDRKKRKLCSTCFPVKDMIKIRFTLRNKLAHYVISIYQKMDDSKKSLFTYCNLFTSYLQVNKIDTYQV